MADAVEQECSDHPNRADCPDALVRYTAQSREYDLIVHDGGMSDIAIQFCPWCGVRSQA
jgi:hypothetical protein